MKWKSDIDELVTLPNGAPLPMVILCSKCDLDEIKEKLNHDILDKFCNENGIYQWFETSAKSNLNIEISIQYLVKKILKYEDLFPKQMFYLHVAENGNKDVMKELLALTDIDLNIVDEVILLF
jgi:GTPase SAR1 family protein